MGLPHAAGRQHSATGKLSAVVGERFGRPTTVLTLGGYRVTALVDTGASRTLLRLGTFQKIILHSHRPRFLRTTGPLQGANGTPLDVRGEMQIKIDHIDSPASVVIVDGISHDMIIGHDLLTAGRCVLDYRQRHLD